MTTSTPTKSIPSVRISPDNAVVLANLGLLKELAGRWHGGGFNLVARPDSENQTATFLELNLTSETLSFTPISSAVPNRGFGTQPDIALYGLTYLQHISDATTGGALHIEPGIWINQPPTVDPVDDPPPAGQLVARMANIPHGNSLVAQGVAVPFSGPPVISPGAQPISGGNPNFSSFPSFNSTPILLNPPTGPVGNASNPIFAAGNSEAQSKPGGGFSEYTLSNPASTTNTRTPLGNLPPVLPPSITQQLVNDPIILLQQTIEQQIAEGYQFEGVALNISTASSIEFNTQPVLSPANPPVPQVPVNVPQFGGGISNLGFLVPNAETTLVYATFWLEKLTHPDGRPVIMQLQYAQMTMLNFPVPTAIIEPKPPSTTPVNFAWPHITVSTLQRSFG
jgi:hypothetical protein